MSTRFAAHHALRQVGRDGQQAIHDAHVLLIGLGGLGCAAGQYLVASGIGALTVCDFDTVAESNLSRQILYGPDDVGRPKTEAAREALARLNPQTAIATRRERMDRDRIGAMLGGCDLLIDASDNYGTRLASNRACLAGGKPWVMGSCIRMEGQLILFNARAGGACYRCVYGSAPETLEDCPGAGVFAPVAGIIGAAMAALALAYLAGNPPVEGFQVLDANRWKWRGIGARRRPDCPDCGD